MQQIRHESPFLSLVAVMVVVGCGCAKGVCVWMWRERKERERVQLGWYGFTRALPKFSHFNTKLYRMKSHHSFSPHVNLNLANKHEHVKIRRHVKIC